MSGNGGGKKSPKFPELPPKYSVSREWRNKAEKLRRNRLNEYLSNVKTLTPIVADKTKKSETTKTNILRAAASYIRLNQMYPNTEESPQPIKKAVNHVEAMKGVVFLLSQTGRILFIGEKIESYIGYTQLELVGVSILDYTHPGDKSKLMRNLERRPPTQPPTKCKLATIGHDVAVAARAPSPGGLSANGGHHLVPLAGPSSSGQPAPSGSQSNGQAGDNDLEADWTRRRSFYVRLKEKPQKQNPDRTKYEHMHILGHLRDATDMEKKLTKDLEFVFVGMMKTVKDRPILELNLMDALQDQYITRHLPDGRIIFSDHRISSVAGYMPDDVRGHSAFNFMVGDDLPWTTLALRTMFASSTREGLVCYRLKTAFGGVITLQSRGYLEVNKDDQKIEHFVCINTLIRPEDSEKILEEQQQRFKPIIANIQNYSLNKLPQISAGPSHSRNKSGKRKVPVDTANMPSKYRVLDTLLAGMSSAQVFASNESGTCLRLATSVTGGGSVLGGISTIFDNQTPSFIGSYGGINNENTNSPAAANPDAAAEPADNSSEIVSLLQELRPEEIVNMLRKKGIKLTGSSSSESTTMSEQNIVQQQNVIVMSQNSSQQLQQQQSSSLQSVQSRLLSPPAGGVEDDYNVDSIDPSVMEVITEVDGYAAENVRQNLNSSRQNSNSSRQNLLHNQQQSVLHRTAGMAGNQSRGRIEPSVNQSGARTGVINQSGGVLRSSSGKLFSVEKGDVNRNVTDANSLLETTMLKGLPGNHQSLPEGHYQQQQTSWQQQQAAGATTSLEQLQDSYNRLSDNISQGASSGEGMRGSQAGDIGRLVVPPGSVDMEGRILGAPASAEVRITVAGGGGVLNKNVFQDSASTTSLRTILATTTSSQQQPSYNVIRATPPSSSSSQQTGFNSSAVIVQNNQLMQHSQQSIIQQVTCQSMMTGAQAQQQNVVYSTAAAFPQQQPQQSQPQGQAFSQQGQQQQKDNQPGTQQTEPDFEMFEIPDFGSLVSDGSGES